MKSEKGITLLALTMTMAVLVILTFTVSLRLPEILEHHEKQDFENDIQILKEAIDNYYAKNGSLPTRNKYSTASLSVLAGIKNINDNNNYYVIDLDELEISSAKLKYGKGFEQLRTTAASSEISSPANVYIINEQSHTIYYPEGVEYDGESLYTSDEPYVQITNVNI